MPMRYANEADVLSQLSMTTTDANYARLVRMENGLCDTFDAKVERSFGVAPVAEQRSVIHYDVSSFYPAQIVLETPLRSVTSVEVGGTWNGTAWTGGTVLTTDQYRLTNPVRGVYYAIDVASGYWSGVVRVTGVWADQSTADIPNDVRQALTFLTVDSWRVSNSSPAGEIGPDGFTVRPRNPWNYETVKTAIERHQVARILV